MTVSSVSAGTFNGMTIGNRCRRSGFSAVADTHTPMLSPRLTSALCSPSVNVMASEYPWFDVTSTSVTSVIPTFSSTMRTFDSPSSVLLSMVRILHRVLGIMNRPMMNVPPVNTAVARFTQNDGQSVI